MEELAAASASFEADADASALCLVAGTFDRLHAGHAALLRAAFCAGRRVEVWVCDDGMTAAKAASLPAAQRGALRDCAARRAAVAEWCDARRGARGRFTVHALADAVGPAAAAPAGTAIACSEETRGACEALNAARAAAGQPPLRIVAVPLLRGGDGAKLSSTALRAAEVAAQR